MPAIIEQDIAGAISYEYRIRCVGCEMFRVLDMKEFLPPITDTVLNAKAVRQGYHLMPFSLDEDKWFCTACAESRGADAKVFTTMREQAKSAAHLKSKASQEKQRVDAEVKERKSRQTIRKSISQTKTRKKTGSRKRT